MRTLNVKGYTILITSFLALNGSACIKEPQTGESDSTSIEEEVCQKWCTVAVPCSSAFTTMLEFDDESTCVASCLDYYDGLSMLSDEACGGLVLDLYTCTTTLECSDFQQAADYYWNLEGNSAPRCADEMTAMFGRCT